MWISFPVLCQLSYTSTLGANMLETCEPPRQPFDSGCLKIAKKGQQKWWVSMSNQLCVFWRDPGINNKLVTTCMKECNNGDVLTKKIDAHHWPPTSHSLEWAAEKNNPRPPTSANLTKKQQMVDLVSETISKKWPEHLARDFLVNYIYIA